MGSCSSSSMANASAFRSRFVQIQPRGNGLDADVIFLVQP